MADARVEIYAPSITRGSHVVYDSGLPNQAMLTGSPQSFSRRIDLYGGNRSLATAGAWQMKLFDPEGLYSEDGLFWPNLREALVVASISGRVVFLGSAVKVSHTGNKAGVITAIHWRDLVDDLAAQRVEGIPTGETEGQVIIAQTTLHEILEANGIPLRVVDLDGTVTDIVDVDIWYPIQSTTIRQWLFPVLAALGYAVDWAANISGGVLVSTFAVTHESRFRNRLPGLPLFTDRSLLGNAVSWDDGRQQIANVWTGNHRTYDTVAQEFVTQETTALVDESIFSVAVASREDYGSRRINLNLSALRVDEESLIGYANAALARRLWPHPRGKMSLTGGAAADLRIGDGFVTDFNLGTGVGRGLARTWRVIGRTINLQDEVIQVEAEMRDNRDEDFEDWRSLGSPYV